MSRSFVELSTSDAPEVTAAEEEVEALSFRCPASSSSKLLNKRRPTGTSAEHADSHEEEIDDSFDLGLEYVVSDTVSSSLSNAPHQSVKKHQKKAVPFASGSFLEPSMDPGLKDYPNDTDYKNDQVEYQAWLRRMEMRKRKIVS